MRHFGNKVSTRDDVAKNRRLIATFSGQQYVGEREGDELRIYLIGDADDLTTLTSTADSMPTRIRALNEQNRRHYDRKAG